MTTPSPPLLIAGSGRSGTTWVLDAIAQANNLRTIFEPLHPIGVPSASQFSNKHVRKNDDFPELHAFFSSVFSGTFSSLWTDYRIRPDRLKPNLFDLYNVAANYKKLLNHYRQYSAEKKREHCIVKCIRANLMLGWLHKNFQTRTVLLLRHPGAVISSKLKLGGQDWLHQQALQTYLQDNRLIESCPHGLLQILSRDVSPVQAHTIIWCIENMLPISIDGEESCCLVFYEDLITKGESEWRRIAEFFQLDKIPGQKILRSPSQQASSDMQKDSSSIKRLQKWMDNFTTEDLQQIEELLVFFNVQHYSAFNPTPLKNS